MIISLIIAVDCSVTIENRPVYLILLLTVTSLSDSLQCLLESLECKREEYNCFRQKSSMCEQTSFASSSSSCLS